METQDGFILGIFNYCDRWCERCPFTSRCRSFSMGQAMERQGYLGGLHQLVIPEW